MRKRIVKGTGHVSRRSVTRTAFATIGMGAFDATEAAVQERFGKDAPVSSRDNLKITKLEIFPVQIVRPGVARRPGQPYWQFMKMHTNAGIIGLSEVFLDGRMPTVTQAVREIEPYLIGKDPRQVVHHWQAIYRHAFYRGGPVLTSALSAIDIALWDIKGKALGVPVYELLGGPTRTKVRFYTRPGTGDRLKQQLADGWTAFKTFPSTRPRGRYVPTPAAVQAAAERFGELRKALGDDVDLAADFHGALSPATAKLLIKALEPYQPMFVEEPCMCENNEVMAEIARGTHLPIATGERIFTKWGFRDVLEKRAATILQPDLCHAGGITEVRLIAGLAEAYYASIAPHNPQGPISIAASIQLAASIPNFLIQEHTSLGEGYIKKPFVQHNSYVDIPTGPGLGIELDEDALASKIGKVDDWHLPQALDREDGSVVDW